MKKILFSFLILLISAVGFSQYIAVTPFGGYTLKDRATFGNAYAYVGASWMWGVSEEAVNARGQGFELLYQFQQTNIPVVIYNTINTPSSGDNITNLNYILLNAEQYVLRNPRIQPYVGVGVGAAIYKGSQSPNSATKFAYDAKAGVKFKLSKVFSIKLGGQLVGSASADGTTLYVPQSPYPEYAYAKYGNIVQFSFTGGLVFVIGRRKS